MKPKAFIYILSALAATALVACGETRGAEKLAPEARISLADAISRAVAQVPGGKAVKAELEKEHGRLVYGVDVAHANRVVEIQVDATDGHIAERDEENEDRSQEASVPVPLARAVATAAAAGQPVSAKIEKKHGDRMAVEVEVVSDGRIREVEVDATTGTLAEVKR